MIDYNELDRKVVDYIVEQNKNPMYSPWAIDSTGLMMPKTLARFGAEWYRCKLIENENKFKVKMEYFPSGIYGSLEKMAEYIEQNYNDSTIKIKDMKILFERNQFQEDGTYRVIFVYQELT